MSIHLDISASLAENIGGRGIKWDDLKGLMRRFGEINDRLNNQHQNGELPFWDLPFDEAVINEVIDFAEEKKAGYDNFVLLGIGGSALGPSALHAALNHPHHNLLPASQRAGCRFFCLDNVDPDFVAGTFDMCNPVRTLYNVVSKSGETAETTAQFLAVIDMLSGTVGDHWPKHIVITTDPDKGPLRAFAGAQGIRAFAIPPKVGGRFTVLTPVGLLPAAMTGIDIRWLCQGAGAMREACLSGEFNNNPAAKLAAVLYLAQAKLNHPIHAFFAYSNRLYPVSDWMRQLWAESLGKRYDEQGNVVFTGPTPVKALGATDQHSQVQLYIEGPFDKVVVFIGARQFQRAVPIPEGSLGAEPDYYLRGGELGQLLNVERRATAYALTTAGRPNITIELDRIDPPHIGALLYLLEAATLYAGGFYNVNPLDQPGVEAGKRATYALMGRKGYETQRREIENFKFLYQDEIVLEI